MTIELAGYITLAITVIGTFVSIIRFRQHKRGVEYVFSGTALLSYSLATGYGCALILIGGSVADEYLRQVGWFFVTQLSSAQLWDLLALHAGWTTAAALLPYAIPQSVHGTSLEQSSSRSDFRSATLLALLAVAPTLMVLYLFSQDVIAFHTGSFWSLGSYSAMMAVRSGILDAYSPYSLMLAFRVVPLFAVAVLLLAWRAKSSAESQRARTRAFVISICALLVLIFCAAFVYSVGMKLQIVDFIAWIVVGRALLGLRFSWKVLSVSVALTLATVAMQFYNANVLFSSFAVQMFHFVGRTGASPFLYSIVFGDSANRIGLFGFAGIGVGTSETPAAEVVKVLAPGLGGHFVASVPYEGFGGLGFPGAIAYSTLVLALIGLCALVARSESRALATLAAITGCAISVSSGYSGWGTMNTGSFGLAPMVYMLVIVAGSQFVLARARN